MKAIELFAGAGLMGLALRDAGFYVVDAVEINIHAADSHRHNVGPCQCMDAREYHPKQHVDLVAGGAPCQPFSFAGNREGTGETRGQLYHQLLRVASESNARAVWMENVPGIMTANGGGDLRQIANDFIESGYHPRFAVLDAASFGTPQHRKRFLLVGFRDDDQASRFMWPLATHHSELRPYVSVRAALGLRGKYKKGRDAHQKGWQGVRAIDVDQPGYTVGTRDNADLLVPADDVAEREVEAMRIRSGRKQNEKGYRLNVPELAVLQGFPKNFKFIGPTSADRHAQVGNALPRSLGAAVARSIATALEVDVDHEKLRAIV